MSRPTTKDALLKASNDGFSTLVEEIESVPDSLRCKEFPFEGRDRTIRDVVCHLHEWHRLMMDWHRVGMSGSKPDIPAAGYTWKTTPALNRVLWERHQSTSLEQALGLLRQSRRGVHDLIFQHTDEELFTKKLFPWTGSTSLGAHLVSSTSSHYAWGLKKVRKLKKHLSL